MVDIDNTRHDDVRRRTYDRQRHGRHTADNTTGMAQLPNSPFEQTFITHSN